MTTLPLEVNSFVGRSHAVAEVCALLGASRVLTLTGAGGVGKTRLAVHSAAVLKATEHLAIPFVDLSTLTQASLVPQTVAAALGVTEQSGRPILETLIDRLRSERLILLLDNCEHVVDACARLVQTLVEACPQLRVVCTSREPLHILGELVWRVSSLTLPDPRRSHRVEELLEYESVRLFCDRAGAVLTGFEVTEANSRAIAQICHRLDGIPLALELAAARVTVLSPEQIVERLDDCFTLLSRGSRTAMGRQQTMKALLDWSFDLLDDDERMLFRRLAVFAGSFSLAALEAIAGTDDLAAAGMLDRLHGLVDKSLVVPVDGAKAVRFRLLEPIRQYAALQLEAAGESMTVHSRHADWYTGLAEAADDALWGRGHRNAVAELERERVNIRSALGWCTAHDRTRGLRLAHAQWQFWLLRGYLAEGRRWFEQLLEGQPKPHPAGARGMLDAWALATRQGNYGATTTAKIEAGIELYRALNDRIGLTQAIHERAIQSYMRGYYDQARPHFEESQAVAIAAGFTPGCALATYGLGIISWAQGRFDEARALMETALELLRTCQPQGPVSTSFLNVGLLEAPYGEFARALTVQEETWVLLRRIEVSVAIGYALANLGNIARLQGRFAEAESYLEASIARFEANGDNAGTSQALGQMGNLLRVTGRYGEARARLERSLTLRRELGDRRGAGRTLNNLGILSIDEGDAARAATFFAESMSLFAEMGDKPGMTATHENMGHLALRTGDFAAARSAYKLGLALSREMGSVNRSIACNSRHRGLAERALGDEAASRTSFLASRALFLEMGDELSVATLDHLLQSPGAPA